MLCTWIESVVGRRGRWCCVWYVRQGAQRDVRGCQTIRVSIDIKSSVPKRSCNSCGDAPDPIQKITISSLSKVATSSRWAHTGKGKGKTYQSYRSLQPPWRSNYFSSTTASVSSLDKVMDSFLPCLVYLQWRSAEEQFDHPNHEQRVDVDKGCAWGHELEAKGSDELYNSGRLKLHVDLQTGMRTTLYEKTRGYMPLSGFDLRRARRKAGRALNASGMMSYNKFIVLGCLRLEDRARTWEFRDAEAHFVLYPNRIAEHFSVSSSLVILSFCFLMFTIAEEWTRNRKQEGESTLHTFTRQPANQSI